MIEIDDVALVEKAIARLQKEKLDTETWLANEESWTSQDDIDHARYYLRIVDCHLAEFEEHENHYIEVFPSDENYWLCNGCGESNAKDVDCEKKSIKAKRLLGKE